MCFFSKWKRTIAEQETRIKQLETELKRSNDRVSVLEAELAYSPTVDKPSPRNLTPRENIRYSIQEQKLEIKNVLPNIWITTVQDTNSMDGLLDWGNTCILTDHFVYEDLAVGDIVVYEVLQQKILHRIIKIEVDEQGRKFTLKGDNVYYSDPFVIRDSNIKWLLLAIVY